MRSWIATLVLALIVLLPGLARAGGTYSNVNITGIVVDQYGNIEFTISQSGNLCTPGSGGGYNQIIVAPGRSGITVDSFKAIQSALTSAYLTGKKVWVSAHDPSPATNWYCDWGGIGF